MKHRLLRGYYDDYNKEVELLSDELRNVSLELATVQNNSYYTGTIALVHLSFIKQGYSSKCFQIEAKNSNNMYIKKKYGSFLKDSNHDDDNMYLKRLSEITYLGYYEDFEVYIGQTLKSIYWFYPNLLDENYRNTYNKLYGKNKIVDREKLIEKTVAKIMMKGSIICTLNKLMSLINRSLDEFLSEEEKEKLFIISENRNLIVHNSGIVNALYIENMRNKNIKCKYVKGQYIFEGRKNKDMIVTNEIGGFIDTLVKKITEMMNMYIDNMKNK